MKIRNLLSILALVFMGISSNNALAIVVLNTDTCGVPDRTGTMTDALHCAYGSGNPDGSTIAGHYEDVWGDAGELTGNGTDGFLSATSDGGWGNIPNSGTWEIDASFWTLYDSAVITMHIGNGGGDPDHFAWLMNDAAASGTWSIDFVGGMDACAEDPNCSTIGGGLSNIRLWGVSGGTSVPAPGAAFLFGLGLLALVGMRKKIS